MKKWFGFILGLVSACILLAAVVGVLRKCHGCPGKRVKAMFSEKDFTVLPLENRDEV